MRTRALTSISLLLVCALANAHWQGVGNRCCLNGTCSMGAHDRMHRMGYDHSGGRWHRPTPLAPSLGTTSFDLSGDVHKGPDRVIPREVFSAIPPDADQAKQPSSAQQIEFLIYVIDTHHRKVTSRDIVYDLGCGDGRILIEFARRHGCYGVGIEIDPNLTQKARQRVLDAGLEDRIVIVTGDARTAGMVENATIITMFLQADLMEELRPRFGNALVASINHEIPGESQTKYSSRGSDIFIRK